MVLSKQNQDPAGKFCVYVNVYVNERKLIFVSVAVSRALSIASTLFAQQFQNKFAQTDF